jgi:MoxR-like ATPase
MSGSAPDARQLRLLARTFAARLKQVKQGFVDRDEAVDLIGLALLCREHVLLVGPPGTAKTALLTAFGSLLDTAPFTYLLTRFTEPAELFGPLDVRRFQRDGVYEINTQGMLPRARLAFLDEVFQGSSAILNTLLTLLNERRFHNGGAMEECALVTLLGSTNELPDDPVLAAFSDRFLLRCRLDYVPDDAVEDVLRLGWRAEQETIRAAGPGGPGADRPDGALPGRRSEAGFSFDDLVTLQRAVAAVDVSPVLPVYSQIVRELRAQGVAFSDRRAVKAQKVFAAAALLAGRARAETADLAPLASLWTDARDEPAVRRIAADHGVEVAEPGRRVRDLPDIRLDLAQLRARRDGLRTAEEFSEVMRLLQRLNTEIAGDHPTEQQALTEVKQTLRETVTLFRERFGQEFADV